VARRKRRPKLPRVELVPGEPNVTLRVDREGQQIVVLSFPYDVRIVEAARRIPGRRFDWDTREWYAPVDDWVGTHIADILARFPELEPSDEAAAWLRGLGERWIGSVSTARHDNRGWFVLRSRAGEIPESLREGALERESDTLVPLTAHAAEVLTAERAARPDGAAVRCLQALSTGSSCRRRGSWSRATSTARGSASTSCGTTTPARRSSSCRAPRPVAACRWTHG
jgi:SWI/SNF-related matrix-associated actin-dependent regulator of chromatin subfamily A-like protein 1